MNINRRAWTPSSAIRFQCTIMNLISTGAAVVSMGVVVWGVASYKTGIDTKLTQIQNDVQELKATVYQHKDR